VRYSVAALVLAVLLLSPRYTINSPKRLFLSHTHLTELNANEFQPDRDRSILLVSGIDHYPVERVVPPSLFARYPHYRLQAEPELWDSLYPVSTIFDSVLFEGVESNRDLIAPVMTIESDSYNNERNIRTLTLRGRLHSAEFLSLRINKTERLVAWSATPELAHTDAPYYYLRHVGGNGQRTFNLTLQFEGAKRVSFVTALTYFAKTTFLSDIVATLPPYCQVTPINAIVSSWHV
jgi:hypothetical protein